MVYYCCPYVELELVRVNSDKDPLDSEEIIMGPLHHLLMTDCTAARQYFHEGLPLTRHVTAQYKSLPKRDDSASSGAESWKALLFPSTQQK